MFTWQEKCAKEIKTGWEYVRRQAATGLTSDRNRARKKTALSDKAVLKPLRANNGQCVAYLAAISATVVSSMRFEKPHSLSYHDSTLTMRPDTLVRVESKFDEAGLWLKSIDTSGSVW